MVQSVALGQAQRWLRWAVWAHVSGLLPFDALLRADHTHTLEGYCFFSVGGMLVGKCLSVRRTSSSVTSWAASVAAHAASRSGKTQDAAMLSVKSRNVLLYPSFLAMMKALGRHLHEMEKHIFCPFQSFSCAGIWLDQLVLLIHSTHITSTVVFHNSMRLSYCPIPETIWNVDLLMPMGCWQNVNFFCKQTLSLRPSHLRTERLKHNPGVGLEDAAQEWNLCQVEGGSGKRRSARWHSSPHAPNQSAVSASPPSFLPPMLASETKAKASIY